MWSEGIFRVAIFMAGGALGSIVMAIVAGGARGEPPAPPTPVHCRNCGRIYQAGQPIWSAYLVVSSCLRCERADRASIDATTPKGAPD